MHILIIPSWYPKRPDEIRGSFFRDHALALSKYGHKVGVVYPELTSLRPPDTWQKVFRADEITTDEGMPTYRAYPINWHLLKLPYANARLWVRKGMQLFSRYVREHGKPDVLHAQSMFNGGLLAFRISRKYGIPYVITEHSSAFSRAVIGERQLKLGLVAAKSASACLAVSADFAAFLDRCYGLPENSWKYVPNIVSEMFAKQPLRDQVSSSEQTFTFCNIALLTRIKGVDVLLRAFARSFSNRPDTKLIVGGDGSERQQLEALANELGLGTQVKFLGHLSRKQVLEVMTSSDAFVLSSHYETFGVVLIEALALGKPVLATRCGGPESIVTPANGLLVEKGSVEALSEGLLHLREQASEYDAETIRSSCLERFGESAVIEQLSEIYVSAIANGNRANG